MTRTLFIFSILISHIALSQEKHFIYIDNSRSINKSELLKKELNNLISETSIDFLLYYSNERKPIIVQDMQSYQEKIEQLVVTPIRRPSQKLDIRLISKQFKENFNNLKIGKGLLEGEIHLHFFLDIENTLRYRYDRNLVNKILLMYNLRDRQGLNDRCTVHYHISYSQDNQETKYDEFLRSLRKKNIKIKTY